MGRGGLFHLDLYLAVAGIDVVELLHTRGAGVGLFFGVEHLVDMEDAALTAQEEAEGVETCILVVALTGLHGEGVEQGCLDEPEAAEVEVVADTACLVVDDGMGRSLAVYDVVVVGIDHGGIGVGGDAEHTVEGSLSDDEARGFRLKQHVVGLGVLGQTHDGVAAGQTVYGDALTIGEGVLRRQF